MRLLFTALLTALTSFVCPQLFAQLEPSEQKLLDELFPATSYFEGSVNYLSNNVYMGRKDSVSIPYISPSFGYYHKSGLFVNGIVSILPNDGRIDLVTLEAGYLFSANHFSGQVTAAKYFYSSKSTNVESEVEGSLHLAAAYNFGFIKPVLEGTLNLSGNSDYGLAAGLSHSFFIVGTALTITPTAMANASTQNFYGSYYNKRRYTGVRKRRNTGILYYDITADLSDASQFQLLNYEFSIPVSYTYKKFTFNIVPTYSVPVNPAEVTIQLTASTGQTTSKTFREKLSSVFFLSAGATMQF